METSALSCTSSTPWRQAQWSRIPIKIGKPLNALLLVHRIRVSVHANITLNVDIAVGVCYAYSAIVAIQIILLLGRLGQNQHLALTMIKGGPPVGRRGIRSTTTTPTQIRLRKIMVGVLQHGKSLQSRMIIAHGIQAGTTIATNQSRKTPMSVSNLRKGFAIEATLANFHMIKDFQITRVQKPRKLTMVDGYLWMIHPIQHPGIPHPLPPALISS